MKAVRVILLMAPILALAMLKAVAAPSPTAAPGVTQAPAATPPPELQRASVFESQDQQLAAAVQRGADQLARNFFTPPTLPDERWLSVGAFDSSAYSFQFYSRDTFEAARGFVFAGPQFRADLRMMVDWFADQQMPNGYIPLWFFARNPITAYPLCPYTRQSTGDGGVEQYDHVAKFIDAVLTVYRWSGDRNWLAEREPQAVAAWNWLNRSTDSSGLIYAKISPYCGADWADAVLRGGYATFTEVDFYEATRALSAIEVALNYRAEGDGYAAKSTAIAQAINAKLWSVSKPLNYDGPAFGHYMGWVDASGVHDYFEVDSNAYAVSSGVASTTQAASIMGAIVGNWGYLVNSAGATRIVYGDYLPVDQILGAVHPPGTYTNGGYWMGVSMYLADALRVERMPAQLADLARRVTSAITSTSDEGLYEWYYANGTPGLNHRQSWALGFPLLLLYGDMAGIDPSNSGLVAHPCLDASIGPLTIQQTFRGKALTTDVVTGCDSADEDGSLLYLM